MNSKRKSETLKTLNTKNKNVVSLEKRFHKDHKDNFPDWQLIIKIRSLSKHNDVKIVKNFSMNEKQAYEYWDNKVIKTFGDDNAN